MWKFREMWKVRFLGNDTTSSFFGVSFSSPSDLDWVLQRTPWCFTGGFLLGASWPSSGNWKDAALDTMPLMLYINNIPLKLFTENNLKDWTRMVDPKAEFRWRGSNLDMMRGSTRIRVNLPVDKRPTVGLFVPFEGKKHWIQFKFERLPINCFKCGIWGHNKQDCSNKPVAIREPGGPLVQLYGPWLHLDYVGTCFTPINGNKEWKVEIPETSDQAPAMEYRSNHVGIFRSPEKLKEVTKVDPHLGKRKSKITSYFGKSSLSKEDPSDNTKEKHKDLASPPIIPTSTKPSTFEKMEADGTKKSVGVHSSTMSYPTLDSTSEKASQQVIPDKPHMEGTHFSRNPCASKEYDDSLSLHQVKCELSKGDPQFVNIKKSDELLATNISMQGNDNCHHAPTISNESPSKIIEGNWMQSRKRIFIKDRAKNHGGKKLRAEEPVNFHSDPNEVSAPLPATTAASTPLVPEAGPASQAAYKNECFSLELQRPCQSSCSSSSPGNVPSFST